MKQHRNSHSKVDIRKGVPPELALIPTPTLVHTSIQTLYRVGKRTGIEYAPAMDGWSRRQGGWCSPTFAGVVVAKKDARRFRLNLTLYLKKVVGPKNARRAKDAAEAAAQAAYNQSLKDGGKHPEHAAERARQRVLAGRQA